MSEDNPMEILKQMKAENAKKENAAAKPLTASEELYSRIFVFPHIRRRLALACVVFFVVALNIVLRDYGKGGSWIFTALPLTAIGLLMTLLPPSETWEYRPWQSKPRQYEKHQSARER